MAAKTFAEAAGAGQRIKKVFVSDPVGGGTIRKIKKIYASDSGGTTRLVFSAEDDLSMITGTAANAVGYAFGGFGSLTPATLGDGAIVDEITVGNHLAPVPFQVIFFLRSYPGVITVNYLTSLTFNGTYTPHDANFTGFTGGGSGGSAQWTWSGGGVPGVGITLPIVVVRT